MRGLKTTLCVLLGLCTGMVAAMEIKAYATIDENEPEHLAFALQFGKNLVKNQPDARYTLLFGGEGVLLVHKESSPMLEALQHAAASQPGLTLKVCQETTRKMADQWGKESLDFVDGADIVNCTKAVKKLQKDGWLKIDVTQ